MLNFVSQNFPHPPLTSNQPMSNKLKLLSRGHILTFTKCMALVVTRYK